MNADQLTILGILVITVLMFLWGKWRHDMVAMTALLAAVIAGLVPREQAFSGFGHPAVITVACVLILSRSLQASGAIDVLTKRLIPASAGPTKTIGALCLLAMFLSSFMNNVGALALLMPVALQVASKQNLPPGQVLMPVAFSSILGGMTTLIGTPPNLIVSGFRLADGDHGFAMFDFTAVGVGVAGAGLIFVISIGWRLVPPRRREAVEGFDTGAYVTEARIAEGSKAIGKTLRSIGPILEQADAHVIGVARNKYRVSVPRADRELKMGDILVIEAEPGSLGGALASLGLELSEDPRNDPAEEPGDETTSSANDESFAGELPSLPESGEVTLMELTVRPGTSLVGRSATDIRLRTRFGINLLALSRQGARSVRRLRSDPMQAGDVLLMQGAEEAILAFSGTFGCVPLAQRSIRLPKRYDAVVSTAILVVAIAGAAFGLLPAAVAFAAGVLAALAFRVVSPRTVYDAVDWPVIVLLAALIPVAGALESTQTADQLAQWLLAWVSPERPVLVLSLVLIVTMTLSDFMNNAATAAVMCPIALGIAARLGANPDTFLMAVAIGASCAFLTPIGHQNNTLILGPGGLRFGDYWKLGLPVEILTILVGVPVLLFAWPL